MIKLANMRSQPRKLGLSEPTGGCGCFPVDIILHVIRT